MNSAGEATVNHGQKLKKTTTPTSTSASILSVINDEGKRVDKVKVKHQESKAVVRNYNQSLSNRTEEVKIERSFSIHLTEMIFFLV